jgi:hypothetical protein
MTRSEAAILAEQACVEKIAATSMKNERWLLRGSLLRSADVFGLRHPV